MNSRRLVIASLMMVFSTTSLIGCGEGMKTAGQQKAGASGQAVDVSADLKAAEEATRDAMNAMAEADEALKSIQGEDGHIKINLFQPNEAEVQSQGLVSPLLEKLRPVFDKLFAKVHLVKAKFNEARGRLVDALTKLDPKDPAQAAMIEQIKIALKQIDLMEQQFRVGLVHITQKLDMAVDALSKVISGVTNYIPVYGWLANLVIDFAVMGDVRTFFAEIKMDLLTL